MDLLSWMEAEIRDSEVAGMTIKNQILNELALEYFPLRGLSYDQLATRLGLNEPSVRRACRQLLMDDRIHYAQYEPVTVAYGRYERL